jgi:hypothetical protein
MCKFLLITSKLGRFGCRCPTVLKLCGATSTCEGHTPDDPGPAGKATANLEASGADWHGALWFMGAVLDSSPWACSPTWAQRHGAVGPRALTSRRWG